MLEERNCRDVRIPYATIHLQETKMNQNVKIAKQLLKIAKMLVADSKNGFKLKVEQIKTGLETLRSALESAGGEKDAIECHPTVTYDLETEGEFLKFTFNLNPQGKYAIRGMGVHGVPQISMKYTMARTDGKHKDIATSIIMFGDKKQSEETSEKPMELFSKALKTMDDCYKAVCEAAAGRILPLTKQGSIKKAAADDAISRILQDTAGKFMNLDQKYEGMDDDEEDDLI